MFFAVEMISMDFERRHLRNRAIPANPAHDRAGFIRIERPGNLGRFGSLGALGPGVIAAASKEENEKETQVLVDEASVHGGGVHQFG